MFTLRREPPALVSSVALHRVIRLLVIAFDERAPRLCADRSIGFPDHGELPVLLDLADHHRLVQVMHRLSGYTYNEIAEELEISVKAVEKHISRALEILRKDFSSETFLFFLTFLNN